MQSSPFFTSFLQHCLASKELHKQLCSVGCPPASCGEEPLPEQDLQPNPLFTFLWTLQLLSREAAFEVT